MTSGKQYKCTVKDEYGNSKSVNYQIKVKNNLVAYADAENKSETIDIEVAPLSNKTLTATATANDVSMIKYKWMDANNNILQGENAYTLSLKNIESSTDYYCEVTDGYGNSVLLCYYIIINNGFNAYIDGTDRDTDKTYQVDAGDDVTLKTVVNADNSSRLSYEWYKYNDKIEDYVQIDNADTGSYTINNVSGYGRYYCYISDGFSGSAYLYFTIEIDNKLSATVYGSDESSTVLNVKPKTTKELKVQANAAVKEGISYQLYVKVGDEDNWEYVKIQDANSDTYVTDPLMKYECYKCEVTDCYGNSDSVQFEIYMNNNFKAFAAGTENETDVDMLVKKGNPVDLKVVISADVDDKISYEWYSYDSSEDEGTLIEDETDDTLSIESINGKRTYYCIASDGYGSYGYVWFYIDVDDSEAAESLTLGTTKTVTINEAGESVWYKFTPASTTEYKIWAKDVEKAISINLYDSEKFYYFV